MGAIEGFLVNSGNGGAIYALSAACTHMGCLVHWNSAEKTWDCPCHGSRFSPEGKCLHGPAVDDLKPVTSPEEAAQH